MICFYCAETILNLLVLLRHFNRLIKTETVRKKGKKAHTHTKKSKWGGGGGGGGRKRKEGKKRRRTFEYFSVYPLPLFVVKKIKINLCCLFGVWGGWVEVSDTCLLSFVIRCDATLFCKKTHVPPYKKHTFHAR